VGVVHADAERTARRVQSEIERRYRPLECLVSPVATAIAVHAGPGAWGVFYQVEDRDAELNVPE
jgi:fatty acid-binding protein DegV